MGAAQDKWHESNKDKNREYRRERDKSDKAKAYRNDYKKSKRVEGVGKYSYTDNAEYQIHYKKEHRINNPHLYQWRSMFSRTLKTLKHNKDNTTETLMGYSADVLRQYLVSLNEDWIEYHVDHKIPITWFQPNTPIHIVNDLRNLHLMSIEDNQCKGNRHASIVDDEYLQLAIEWVDYRYRSSLK